MSEQIDCAIHGASDEAWICKHIHAAGQEGPSPGFNYVGNPEKQYPDAWCDMCESHLIAHGGEWNDATQEFTKIVLLCAQCYSQYRALAEGQEKVRAH